MEVDPPAVIDTPMSLFPFSCKKLIFSLNSDFFRDGNLICRNNSKQLATETDDEQLLHKSLPDFPCKSNGCQKTFTSVRDYEIHYRMSHTFICTSCKKSFPSYSLLDHHLEEVHDNYFNAEKSASNPVFSCLAPGCKELFSTGKERKEHCIKVHFFPADFKFSPAVREKKSSGTQMELDPVAVQDPVLAHKSRKTVPYTVCFGRGSERCFVRSKKAKIMPTSSDINMKDLSESLNEI